MNLFTRSTWLHLRIPFSYFLMPVYLFALALSVAPHLKTSIWTFIIIHLLIYPASNGYNSYFDKDEKSIGGLRNPPPVDKGLYYSALILDGLGILLAIWVSGLTFAAMIFVYGLVSKAYSHPSIRLKKYPVAGWLIAGFFQGFFSLLMCYAGINPTLIQGIFDTRILLAGALTSLMLLGNYPMTQVYQHEEDALHGDYTMSRMLGIRGTFIFVQVIFLLTSVGFMAYFNTYYTSRQAFAFLLALSPVITFFMYWFIRMLKDPSKADFTNTMRLNFISATCLNGFFAYLWMTGFFPGSG